MKEKEPSITQKSKISFLVQRSIKLPGIHYEYRDFSDFLTLFEMAQLANLLKEGIILPEDKSAGSVGAEPSLLTLHYFGSAAWAGAYNLFFSHKYFSSFYYFACVDKVLNHTVGSWRG